MSDQLTAGAAFGHYRIVSRLGAGGMGEVYLAEDTVLERKVALKILPQAFVQDEERLRRFVQEAKAASALNHPNIITIYEIGQSDGAHFLATEYIDGRTLREVINGGRPLLREVLDIVSQAASGLAAAHTAGIVHRDIKPENMMLRHDGFLKILDFGLAKLAEPPESSEAPTVAAAARTDPGVVMGTARYMSPEQARGLRVDARSDIFSLGVVLYEMAAGRPPFEGPSASHIMVAILEKDPPPLTRLVPETPAELERIVTKALVKDPEERYQTIKDLSIDLKRLRQRQEIDSELARSTPSQGLPAAMPRRRVPAAALAAGVLLLAVVGFLVYRWLAPAQPATSLDQLSLQRLTTSGRAFSAAISPDGRYVVHAVNEAGQRSLWMRQVATGSNVQIAPPAEVGYTGLVFSRDGNFLYFTKFETGQPATLYRMPVLGGAATKVVTNLNGIVTLSPDGSRLAFVRQDASGASQLLSAQADGSGEKVLATRKRPDFYRSPAWSPDGKTIAAFAGTFTGGYHAVVITIPREGGPERPVGSKKWFGTSSLAWLSDGRSLALAATDQPSFVGRQIWRISYPDGALTRFTNDLNDYSTLSLTADSQSLVTVQGELLANLWVMPAGRAAEARQITTGQGRRDGANGVSWATDGRVVFSSRASGSDDLWTIRPDGSDLRQITAGARINLNPSVCGDGRSITLTSDRVSGNPHIWRIDPDGGNPRQVTSAVGEEVPSCSPDGKWVAYMTIGVRPTTLWRVSLEGGQPVQLTQGESLLSAVSPDGSRIAFNLSDDPATAKWRLAVMPAGGGAPTHTFEFAAPNPRRLQWAPDGTAVTYVHNVAGVSNLWSQSLSGGPPQQITDFKSDNIHGFAWSPDGKRLVLSRGQNVSDVVLLRGFR